MSYKLITFKSFLIESFNELNEAIKVDKELKERKSKKWRTFHYRHEPIFKRKKDYYRVDYKLFDSNWRSKFRRKLSPEEYKAQILEPDKEYHREYRSKLKKINKKSLSNKVLTSGEKKLLKKYEDAKSLDAQAKRDARAINSEYSRKIKKISEIAVEDYAKRYEKKTGKKLSEEEKDKIRILMKRRLNPHGVHATANDVKLSQTKQGDLTDNEKKRLGEYDKQASGINKALKSYEKEGILDKESKKEVMKELKDTNIGKIMYR